MLLLKMFSISIITFCLLCLLFISKTSSASIDSDLTVDKANEYIQQHKDTIDQTYRPKYHFAAPIGWINDPNGVIFFRGEYHLFYQYNPYNTYSQRIHWGHAKSKDLIHWEHLPVALAPDQYYDWDGVFSGSAIVKDDKLYLIYTGHTWQNEVQCVAVSEDGIHFEKVPQNPVLDANDLPPNAQRQDFRDPKVIQRGDTYYLVVASKTNSNTGQLLLYQSSDLIDWQFKSILLEGSREEGEMWECPDLFELEGKDVLIMSPISYPRSGNDYYNSHSVLEFVGEIDWEQGKLKVESLKEIDHGMDYYATQTILGDQNRRIAIAWMSMWGRNYPTDTLGHKWAGSMTLPRELHLKDNKLIQVPISVSAISQSPIEINNVVLNNEAKQFEGVAGEVALLELVVNLEEARLLKLHLRKNSKEETIVSFDSNSKEVTLDRSNSGISIIGSENPPFSSRKVEVSLKQNKLSLQIFLDQSSIEVFVNGGEETLTATVYPTELPSNGILFEAEGKVVIESLSFALLNP
ncbi:hypothetical protein ILUMI_12759 [Ignelater luminosus]|uniref:Sucrose-6-phosphate hydrolase n=1 Tax=Ignelater luminosus TaxID=2038154 RepID=A0A8K0G6H0_IGNLU|nr:hypothetical protein ILUMI_12759 [Ignelater luminosus]